MDPEYRTVDTLSPKSFVLLYWQRDTCGLYLFEFRVLKQAGPGAALAQFKAKRYADKYRHRDASVHPEGVAFTLNTRNEAGFDYELAWDA